MTLALPALWKGIFYDVSALEALDSLTSDWDRAQVIQMQRAAAMDGIRGQRSNLVDPQIGRRSSGAEWGRVGSSGAGRGTLPHSSARDH